MEKYETVKDLGSGSWGVVKLMRNKNTQELVAVKFLKRGNKINDSVAREIINHRSLHHPNIIGFREVFLTPEHLAIVMEHAAGGDIFDKLCDDGILKEDEARYYFQQLIAGVAYCHSRHICHRDLKLENVLLDGSGTKPCLKICDFGYSKSYLLHSRPKSRVGTPQYIAPEVLFPKVYNGKAADVWSCGVSLYVMLVPDYPFEDPTDRDNIKKTIERISSACYKIPDYLSISEDCKDLLAKIFVVDPCKRISIEGIKKHPWFLKNLPDNLTQKTQAAYQRNENTKSPLQSVAEITRLVEEAKSLPPTNEDDF